MGFLEGVALLLLTLPVAIFILTVHTLSLVGKYLGFRRKYVSCLLYIFEVSFLLTSLIYWLIWRPYPYFQYGRKKIEGANRAKQSRAAAAASGTSPKPRRSRRRPSGEEGEEEEEPTPGEEDVDDGISTASESDYLDGGLLAAAAAAAGPPCTQHASHIGLGQISEECKIGSPKPVGTDGSGDGGQVAEVSDSQL